MAGHTTDLDKAHAALRLLQDTCDAAIDALQQPLSSTQIALLPSRPTPDILHKDTQALLTLVYTSTTKVALVLRPATPAPAAALAPIADLGTSVTSLATCATLYGFHGATLAADARRLARDVVESVRAFVAGMVGADAGAAGEGDYLVRTGAVHDLVERARKEMPVSNVDAVKRRWRADREMVADAAGEIDAMLEDGAGEGDEDEDEEADELDEEWGELGFGSSKKMSPEEVERTKKVQPLVRFATLFHKRVLPDVLGVLPATPSELDALNAALDALPPQSNAIVLAVEEVVAALYAPQKPDVLAAAITSLVQAARRLHALITVDQLMPSMDLAKEMAGLSVEGAPEKKPKDPRKWFALCIAQIDKSAKVVDEIVSLQTSNAT